MPFWFEQVRVRLGKRLMQQGTKGNLTQDIQHVGNTLILLARRFPSLTQRRPIEQELLEPRTVPLTQGKASREPYTSA